MRALVLFLIFIVGLLSSIMVAAEKAYAQGAKQGRVVNDSLVQNLSCQNLSVDSIYRAIRDDAFEQRRNMPIRNWSFRSGLVPLAGCWGLASTQRMVSYMARYNTSSSQRMEKRVPMLLDMVRRETLEENQGYNEYDHDNKTEPYYSKKLKKFNVFAVEESNLNDSSYSGDRGLWNRLMRGYTQELNGQKVIRNFKSDIEVNQANHFFRAGNIGMGMGNGVRSEEKNRETVEQLMRNLDGKRLTLINLRFNRTTQHVVMVKSYQRAAKDLIEFTVYDSNSPYRDQIVYFSTRVDHFYSPDVMGFFEGVEGSKALGVYIVDEEERESLEQAMLAFYRSMCR